MEMIIIPAIIHPIGADPSAWERSVPALVTKPAGTLNTIFTGLF